MCRLNNDESKKTNNGRKRIAKSRKNQNPRRKENLQIFGNSGIRHKHIEVKENSVSQMNMKTSRNPARQQESHQRDIYLGCPHYKIPGTNLKMNEGRTLTIRQCRKGHHESQEKLESEISHLKKTFR